MKKSTKKSTVALPKKALKVGIVQLNNNENLQNNLEIIKASIVKVAKLGAKVVCFPENSLFLRIDKTKKIEVATDLKEKYWQELAGLANELQVHILLGSVALKQKSKRKFLNSTVYIQPGKSAKSVYSKIHLFDVDVDGAPVSRESEYFDHGNSGQIIDIEGWRWGLSICYDLRFPELYRSYMKKAVHVMFVPSAFLVPTGKAHWHVLLRARAIENQAYVVAPAQSGEHQSVNGHTRYTYGHSLVVAPWGEVLMDLEKSGYDCAVIELTTDRLLWVQGQIPARSHIRL